MENDFQRKMRDMECKEQVTGVDVPMTLCKESFLPIASRIMEVIKKSGSKEAKNYLEKHSESIQDGIIIFFFLKLFKKKNKEIMKFFLNFLRLE